MPFRWRFSRSFRRVASADFLCRLGRPLMSRRCLPRFAIRPRRSDGWQSQSVLAARLRARKRRRVSVIAHLSRRAARMAKRNPPLAVAVFVVAVSPATTFLVALCLSASVRLLKGRCRVVFRRVSRGSCRASAALPSEAQPCGQPRSLRSLDAAR